MMNIPGLKADIGFGGVNKALPDWRKSKTIASEIDPDDEQIETPADVVAVLGFDPAKDETMTMTQPKSGLHTALVKRMKGAKNASQLAMFSPSPCISAYGAGKQQRVARNSGTSDGEKQSWAKRHAGLNGPLHWHHVSDVHSEQDHREMTDYAKKVGQYHHGIGVVPHGWKRTTTANSTAQADTLRERLVRRLAKSKRPKPLPGQKPALTGHGWSQQNWWEAKGGTKV